MTIVVNIHLPQIYCTNKLVDLCKEHGLIVLITRGHCTTNSSLNDCQFTAHSLRGKTWGWISSERKRKISVTHQDPQLIYQRSSRINGRLTWSQSSSSDGGRIRRRSGNSEVIVHLWYLKVEIKPLMVTLCYD